MRIEADKRRMPAEERPRTHAWLAKRQPVWLDGDLRYAKAFDDIATSRHYKTVDCATLGEYGEALGYDAPQVRRWRDIDVLRTCGATASSCASRLAPSASCARDA